MKRARASTNSSAMPWRWRNSMPMWSRCGHSAAHPHSARSRGRRGPPHSGQAPRGGQHRTAGHARMVRPAPVGPRVPPPGGERSAYTPPASRITLTSRRRDGRLEFTVEDAGPGIDSADLPLIFQKFFRGKNSSARGKGTGMGLPLCALLWPPTEARSKSPASQGRVRPSASGFPSMEKQPAISAEEVEEEV